MSGPKISILMACYNSGDLLNRSVQSVLNQTYKNWELICIDNCSTDDTYARLQEFARHDPRIKCITKHNSGHAAPNFNVGLQYVTGNFIFLLGHDDALSADCLENMVARQMETDADVVIPDLYFVFPENSEQNWLMGGVVQHFGEKTINPDRDIILDNRTAVELSALWRIHAFALYRAGIVKKYRFCEDGMSGDEYSAREFLFHANKVTFSSGTYHYYQHADSITKKMSPRPWETWQSYMYLEKFLRRHKFSRDIIKQIHASRVALYEQLKGQYLEHVASLSLADRQNIERSLAQNYRYLYSWHQQIRRFFIHKQHTETAKYFVLFNCVKIKYEVRK